MNQHDMTEQAYKNGYEKGKADAMKSIVRCKDCKHYKPRNQSALWKQTTPCCSRSAALKFPADGFCSYGERRIDHAEN